MKRIEKKTGMAMLMAALCCAPSCSGDDTPAPNTNPVGGIRYNAAVFSQTKATRDVVYGENNTQDGVRVKLAMNIFEPANDTVAKRPLVVLAHGGGFAEGDKEDFDPLAQFFAKSGYVAATISYRLMAGPEAELTFAVVDAVQDMKAAVRYFTIDNKYNIDPENIFIGGFSAGAVVACHYAYFNAGDIPGAPAALQDYLAATGGLSGNSGNPGGGETVKGVVSIAGGLLDASWVGPGEPILYSIHGDNDTDVSCTKDPEAQANPDGDFTEGPCLIHPIMDRLGITNRFYKIVGGGHGAYFDCQDCDGQMRQFLFENL